MDKIYSKLKVDLADLGVVGGVQWDGKGHG